jgi:hypothetical protein
MRISSAKILIGLCAAAAIVVAVRFALPKPEQPPSPDAGVNPAGADEEYPWPLPKTPADPAKVLFRECAAEVGIDFAMRSLPNEQREIFKINLYDHGCGLAVGDFDGDGRDDIYFCNQFGANALYRNRGDSTFEEMAERAGVALGDRVCVGATFVDYDNDGKPDLFVTSTRGGNVLFHNLGGGKFQDVTERAGLKHIGHSQTAVFFDYDNDGFLDLFLANTAQWTTENYDPESHSFAGKGGMLGESKEKNGLVSGSAKEFNVLYRNNGDGTFRDATNSAGLRGCGWAGDAVAFDYDGDGKIDLFVTNMFGRCQLYHNDGGVFHDTTLTVLGRTPCGGTGAHLLDFNNDGRLDLFVVDMHSDMWMGLEYNHNSRPLAVKLGNKKFLHLDGPLAEDDPLRIASEKAFAERLGYRKEEVLFGNAFYRNDGGGRFTEISDRAGLETFWPWGIAAGDFNNDGYQDVFVTSGMGYPFYYWPNHLMLNNGDGTFHNGSEEAGVEPPARGICLEESIGGRRAVRSSRCAVTGDFDGDGRLEIVTNNFNDRPYYYKNEAARKNYVAFRLRGTKSNRDAIGAVVRLQRGSQVMTRQVQGAGGYLSQSSKTVHFGLGDRMEVDKVEIAWPSGIRQVLRGEELRLNGVQMIVETAKGERKN